MDVAEIETFGSITVSTSCTIFKKKGIKDDFDFTYLTKNTGQCIELRK